MRTPETKYFERGYIRFFKRSGDLLYSIYQWDAKGMNTYLIDAGIVRDEQHLKELQALGSVKT